MANLEHTVTVDRDGLARLRQPRTDLLIERQDGPDAWTIERGPFRRYRRELVVEADDGAATDGTAGDDEDRGEGAGTVTVTERYEYKLALPVWWPYLWFLFRRGLRDLDRTPRRRWWWPREVVGSETSTLIALLGTVGMMAGYMGVLIGQTITFAANDFGVDDDDQANTLAAVRVGVLISMVLLGRADRRGRRPLVLGFALTAILFTASGALSTSMLSLGASQTVARGLTTGLLTLVTLASTEEVPASSRALSISFMTLTTGFGAALVVWILPVADIATGGWRIAFLVPLIFLPLLWWISRHLPETRRYVAAEIHDAPAPINWKRFALIAGTAFVSFAYLSPASQLRNEFLRGDLGFSATEVSTFQLLVSLPATMAVPIGGIMADRYGRRWFGAGCLALAVICSAISYQSSGGWVLWVTGGLAVSLSAASVPALRGYQTELFPTRARGRVGGLIDTIGVAGSALGLVVVGQLAVRWDDLGSAIGALVAAPLVVAIVIVIAFPETAQRELEEFNPGDPRLPDTDPGGPRPNRAPTGRRGAPG
ncbi:MAG: MFS transporter [Actinomycetota bacterium]